ncbi:MAG: glycosyltransferase family 4 protein [Candidatus Bathyarchaeia archaeon]
MFWFPKWVITRFNIPVVSWLPGPPPRLKRRLICSLVSHPHFGLFAHGDTVKVLEDELGFVRGIEFEVIEPGVDLSLAEAYDPQKDVIRSNLNISSETVVGITVARLIPIKNIHFLIEGLALSVHELGVSIVWLIVGDGPERSSLKQLVKAKGLEGCVHWLGQMQQSEVHRILAAGDIFALTSTYESFSMATLEAMAHRLPIVATNVGYLRTIVQESGGGILVNLRDFKGLAQAIAMLASDPDYRRQLGDRGHIYVQRFNWPNIIAKLLRFYEQVMVGRPCMKS